MKLALVRARYTPYGGAERFVNVALSALAEAGLEISVLARQWPAGSDTGLPFHFERCDPFYLGSTWRDRSFAHAIQEIIANRRFDLVQSHERIPGVSLYRAGDGVHAAWLERRRARLDAQGRIGLALNPHHAWLCRAERDMFEHPALRAVICNSDMVREEIAARFAIDRRKLRLIRNAVDLQRFTPLEADARAALRLRLELPEHLPVLLFMGSGFARKGLADALRATARATAAGAALHLVVAGADKHARRYHRLAQALGLDHVCRFVGALADPLPYYQAADGLILPTIYDPFPNAALEALACGLAVLTSEGCGAKEVIAPGVSGWIAPVGDISVLASHIAAWARLQQQPEPRRALRAAARAAALPFAADVMRAQLLALYQELLAAS